MIPMRGGSVDTVPQPVTDRDRAPGGAGHVGREGSEDGSRPYFPIRTLPSPVLPLVAAP